MKKVTVRITVESDDEILDIIQRGRIPDDGGRGRMLSVLTEEAVRQITAALEKR